MYDIVYYVTEEYRPETWSEVSYGNYSLTGPSNSYWMVPGTYTGD